MKAILIAILLSGCAQASFSGLCAVIPIAQDESGAIAVRYRCEPS